MPTNMYMANLSWNVVEGGEKSFFICPLRLMFLFIAFCFCKKKKMNKTIGGKLFSTKSTKF